jgi:hypothetical protein
MLSNLSRCSWRKNKTVIAIASIYEISKDVVLYYFWNFSDPIVEVNSVVRHFCHMWVLMRKFGNECVEFFKFWGIACVDPI